MTTTYPDHPQLRGNFAPLRMECDLHDVIVEGEIPRDLNGSYYRNGPDPQFPPLGHHHWFAGDGMIHGFHLEDGRVSYRNRWVRTVKWQKEREAGRSLFAPFDPMANDPAVGMMETDGLANTNIVWHGRKLLALEEGHAPIELDPHTLETIGPWNFDDEFEGPMTAHPKLDPRTGEMLFFGYMADGLFSREISLQIVDRQGRLERSETFAAPFASMVHDFITTDEHIIFPIFPLSGSLERAMLQQPAFAWEPELGTHIGVMPREGSVSDIRWFETDPCFVFHPMNAYSEGDRITAHVMQFEEAPLFPHLDGSRPDPKKANARLCEWTIDLGSGFESRYLDDLTGEFPRLDERFTGQRHRHGYYAGSRTGDGALGFDCIVHHDLATGERRVVELPEGDRTDEPIFVPRSGGEEGDGYLVALHYRAAENRSDLAIYDAPTLTDGPVALAQLPHRVPHGFHGNWRPADGESA